MEVVDALRLALADRYAIERELGQGGMASVYLAEDLKHHRRVALKLLRPELAHALGPARFLREIETTAQLAHPHILPLLDSGEVDGQLFYTMPLVEGESLRDRLTRERQLPLDDALRIAREVADALGYAHALGVVHRDIKPENILFEAGHAVVADFGIAKAIATAGSEQLTETGLAVGTPAYMSPEQAAGAAELDGRSDLYSLGCVLYEMLAGEPPFTGPSVQAVVAKRLSTPAPRVSILRQTVPPHVEQALAMALALAPADRFATAAQFAAALTGSSTRHAAGGDGARHSARRVAGVAAGLVVVVVAVGLLFKVAALSPGGGARPAKSLRNLAVLPLANLSGDSTQEYFADGMTDAVITELAKISALTVRSRTSVMGFKGARQSLPEIAKALHVEGVIEGSVLREGGRVRVNARLIDARTDEPVWDSTYDREEAAVLTLYAEVARTIATAIGAALTPEETRRLQVDRRVDPRAYDEYLLGRREAMLWTSTGWPLAIAHYRRAIALDSTFSDPHAGLVEAYWGLALTGDLPPKASAPLVEAAAERAVALDPASARAHVALAQFRAYWQWRWDDADAEYRRALELNPGLADLYLTYVTLLTGLGRHDESIRHALRAVALDPLLANSWSQLGWAYFYAGRLRESIAADDSSLRRTPSFPIAYMQRSWALSALGKHREALASIDSALAGDSAYQPVLGSAALVYSRAGRPVEARGHLASLLAFGRTKWVDPYNVGWAYAFMGQTERAIETLTRAADELSPSLWGLKVEWLPEAFKADPRYHALLRRIHLE